MSSEAIDKRIDDVILRTLAKEPGSRFQTAGEVGEAVDRVARSGDRPPGAGAGPSPSRGPTRTCFGTALCFASLLLAAISTTLIENPFPLMLFLFPAGVRIRSGDGNAAREAHRSGGRGFPAPRHHGGDGHGHGDPRGGLAALGAHSASRSAWAPGTGRSAKKFEATSDA